MGSLCREYNVKKEEWVVSMVSICCEYSE